MTVMVLILHVTFMDILSCQSSATVQLIGPLGRYGSLSHEQAETHALAASPCDVPSSIMPNNYLGSLGGPGHHGKAR
ncbi:uncharacterized protein F5891DRAFT_1052448 [Suillus fuscotomentosus]|uniref:Secreted protein n=1 Tax=Suillus fuscotomentosus TaxID=1912939 RepID=A0AAD4HGD0_9AGAM|nr:uncharacterized protein F5891DRAFT_1058143 [Suillus fuscotomentosus]XP_041222201.1 uncharacterized protein F5891DRAFT_1052448 [Suillus fuscotomentosus]KAG1895594.1 hypothetical protein F5891DRAFT_1058143 [Suillus fuscotomentosus]KAG1896625.1 hypothetical protein F5891DRAFT_1052448 [Suillus fuscotomentosus]